MHIARNVSALLMVAFLLSSVAAAEGVFSDDFESLSRWTKASGAEAKRAVLQAGEATTSPCMLLGNGVARAELPQVLDKDFELSFRGTHNAYRRGLWVGLFNHDGSKGYAAIWDASDPTFFEGQGNVAISKFDLAGEVTFADQLGTVLTKRITSGRKAVGEWPPLFVLTWEKASGLLILSVNGVEKGRIVDRSFGSFSRIYLRGNEASAFADLRITTKSPTTRPAGATQP